MKKRRRITIGATDGNRRDASMTSATQTKSVQANEGGAWEFILSTPAGSATIIIG